jgi:Raf kinase inhibitor-like YbhB/YbcL family protein
MRNISLAAARRTHLSSAPPSASATTHGHGPAFCDFAAPLITMSARKISTLFVLGAATLLLANCSDDSTPSGPSSAGQGTGGGGTAAGGGGATAAGTNSGGSGGGTAGGGSASGGTSSAGGPTAGSGGSTAGSGGTSGGAGGSAGSSNGGGGSGGSGGAGGSGGTSSGAFTLTSTDLMNGAKFQDKNTCNGKAFGDDESPAFAWTEPPAGTKSFALVFIDVTLTASNPANPLGHHWMAYNIPAATRALPADLPDGATLTTPVALKQIPSGYLGPCPGGTLDSYEFTLYALNVETIDPGAGGMLTKAMVDKVKAASIGMAVLGGKSDAKSK